MQALQTQVLLKPVQTLHTNGDYHFPRLGMICNVISCPTMTFFSTYAKYMEHFIKTHRSHVHIYKCI